MSESPQAGWYPIDDGRLQWWDGQEWAEAFAEPRLRGSALGDRRFLRPLAAALVLSAVVPPLLLVLSFAGVGGSRAQTITFAATILLVLILLVTSATFFLRDREPH